MLLMFTVLNSDNYSYEFVRDDAFEMLYTEYHFNGITMSLPHKTVLNLFRLW